MAERTLHTAVYVDGFNFYYGALRGTTWKWLNLQSFFAKLLEPHNQVNSIRYYTAKVRPTLSDRTVHHRQDAYLRAVGCFCPLVQVHFGHFLRHQVWMENVNPPPARTLVYKNEEKGSDVNLALHLLEGAWRDEYDCAVIVSNDSDLAEALKLVKLHGKVIGLITPGAPRRSPSRQLLRHADFLKRVSQRLLASNQLPETIPGTNLRKPHSW